MLEKMKIELETNRHAKQWNDEHGRDSDLEQRNIDFLEIEIAKLEAK